MKNFLKNRYKSEGALFIPQMIFPECAEEFKKTVESAIIQCAKELNVPVDLYLSAVSRWMDPSPVTAAFPEFIQGELKDLLEELFSADLELKKFNVICKSPHARDMIPCHQDIAYSKDDPYEFSLWLALTDVAQLDGALEVLTRSQLDEIRPAIDFWDPEFKDEMRNSDRWKHEKKSYIMNKGDAVLFDSRVWHGSALNTSNNIRIALVTRWKTVGFAGFNQTIPEKKPAKFGMWSCGNKTFECLKAFMDNSSAEYTAEFIHSVVNRIKSGNESFNFDNDLAVQALSKLAILHQASQTHNGGDALGVVYADVWKHFLYHLNTEEVSS